MGYDPTRVCGFQRLTTSGVVSDSGKPILIAGYSVDAAGSATTPTLFNGTAATAGGAFKCQTTTASQSLTQSIPLPVMLPLGCYVSFDANTTAVTVFYVLQSVTS